MSDDGGLVWVDTGDDEVAERVALILNLRQTEIGGSVGEQFAHAEALATARRILAALKDPE